MDTVFPIGTWLEKRVSSVIDLWLGSEAVKNIFIQYHINIKAFSVKFATDIVLYNIRVLEGKKKPDDCPIMSKFVDYMLEKNIRSEDIFKICVGLRTTILNILWEQYPDFANDVASIKKIFEVFDRNLAGVLANFDRKNLAKYVEKHKTQGLELYLNRLETVLDMQDNIIFKIYNNKLYLANKALFTMTGVHDIEDFKNKFSYPLEFIKKVHQFEAMFKAKEYDKWIENIIKNNNGMSKVEFFNHSANQQSLMQMKVVRVQDENDYIFTLTNITNQQKNIKKLSELVYKDPLTNLANLRRFEEMIDEKLKKFPNNNFQIFMIHLQGFKIMNEVHGKENGEHLLKNVAEVLKEHFPHESARIDIDRFAVLSNKMTLSTGEEIVKEINSILSKDKYASKLDVSSAIVLLHESDTKESALERGETLLNHVEYNNTKLVYEESAIHEQEKERLKNKRLFLQQMGKFHDMKQTVPITNYYLEIGIKSDAVILDVTNDLMMVGLKRISVFSLSNNDCVYIEMPKKPHFKGMVRNVDVINEKVLLGDFEAVETSPLDRKSVQVKLQKHMDIMIKSPKNNITAELDSLSTNAFIIMTSHLYDIEIGTNLTMQVKFIDNEVEFSGIVRNIIPIADMFILIVRLNETHSVENTLMPFIANRQMQIIKELHKL
ncbi:diguanylate cyclase [bacterium]|nr:diguanylate cyclase [bacterium]MBU1882884.1 diguanylate cyclase [bacterium]